MAKRGRGRRGRRGSPVWRVLKGVLLFGVAAIVLSVLWVAAHAFIPVGPTSLMMLRAHQGQTIERRWVRIEDVSPYLVTAVIAAEDTKFCAHPGFDVENIKKAIEEAKAGRRMRGASTLSQQTAKNVFLWPGRGWVRKGLEVWFTGLEELFWSKRRILEVYLNVAEWGDGNFGAEAAAKARFGKTARELNKGEAALLAAVLPNPAKWRVDPPGPYVRSRAGTLRARMDTVRAQGLDGCVLSEL
ncbi:monofunctional biosynthetic peptidoglycan transglycosylase [Parvularcula dongshanensis]|uniref:monofunctional biosynthetic peptidoglycan transglycosylase n=1 Tax=Parvularcula dongshanensis TaxID=1173995 RepID=UPI001FEC3C94|nr:monofunctional biosynthetic peptidoglycan transglycosylase [Parvularcula dongshanensis]